MRHPANDMLFCSEEELLPTADNSLMHFCQFIEYYTRYSTDPMCTAAACENQAKDIRITSQDISSETIRMLLDTMLNVIDHMEKKWLDDRVQFEEKEQRELQRNPQPKQRQTEIQRLKYLVRTWMRGAGNLMKGEASYAR